MFVKAKEKKLYEEVVRQIRDLIETGRLKEGDRLPSEAGLAERMGLSRATVREGLRVFSPARPDRGQGGARARMSKSGLEENIDQALSRSLQSMAEESYYVYQMDRLLEPAVAAMAATSANEEDLAKIAGALERLGMAEKAGEPCESVHEPFP